MGITDLYFSLFYLLSFYFYIRSEGGFRNGYVFSVVSFFLATLCKEPALTLPLVLIAYDWAFEKGTPSLSKYLERYDPYVSVIAVYFILRFYALGSFFASKSHSQLTPKTTY